MMVATPCPTEERLRAFGLGKLSLHDSDDLFDHVKTCTVCQAELDTMQSSDDSLVENLRAADAYSAYQGEPNCQLAVARALGALAQVDTSPVDIAHTNMPQRMGEYEIVRRLGRGGMGSVYLGRHTKLGREVAIKVLAHHRLSDDRVVERFESEIKAIGRLSHPHIVSAYDAREVDGMAVLITEYINGFDVGAILKRTGPLSIANACEIIRQTAHALEYTHQQGFVHRDVKPGNIMVSREGHVKLLDLGLARLQFGDEERPDITGTGQAIGTADFIAPEQVTDGRSVDHRADIYSLGCTFYKLLTGKAPFETEQHLTAFAKMTAHVSKAAPSLARILPTVPAKLARLVDAMIAKSPQKRPQSLRAVIDVVSELAAGADLSALVQHADRSMLRGETDRSPIALSTATPVVRPWYARRVPLALLIATGFFSAGIGFLLGLLITIKHPDGTIVQHEVPDHSEVTIRHTAQPPTQASTETMTPRSRRENFTEGRTTLRDPRYMTRPDMAETPKPNWEATEQNLGRTTPSRTAPSGTAPALETEPLFFGIIANQSERGHWIDIGKGVQVSGPTRQDNGRDQVLLDNEAEQRISWNALYRRLSANFDNTGLSLVFHEPLNNQMGQLTESNIGRQLAIVLNGKLVAAPKIVSPLTGNASLQGLNRDEVQFLMQALSGLVSPVDSEGTASPSTVANNLGLPSTPPTEIVDREVLLRGASQNLKNLALAMMNYDATHRRLPASANSMRDGQALPHPYSWRIAILPFLGPAEAALFKEYKFDEPWDSDANRLLLEKMPAIFRSPGAPASQPPGETNYFGFVGQQGALGGTEGRTYRDIPDGTSNTILLVETKKSIPWTKPEDIPLPTADDVKAIRSHDGNIHGVMVDGSVRVLSPEHPFDTIMAFITIAGGEQTPILPQ